MEIFIPENVPSSKNSKVKTSKGIFHSKAVRKYLSSLGIKSFSTSKKQVDHLKKSEPTFYYKMEELRNHLKDDPPHRVGFHFVRKDKRSFDFHNMVQLIADLMVAYDAIEDDDMDHFIPLPYKKNNNYYTINKEEPGVYIKLYK